MRPLPRLCLRVLIVVSLVGAALSITVVAPARTLTFPRTLTGSLSLSDEGRAVLGVRPTHVMFSWRGSEGARVVFRTISASGIRSQWQTATVDHDAERGSLHYSGIIEVSRPELIRYRTRVPGRGWIDDVHLDYVNTLDGPLRRVTVPAAANTAGAAASTPDIRTRAEWGANEAVKRTSGGCRRQFYKAQQLFVHHTAGSNFDSNGDATMRAIQSFHVRSRGWCDVGYNFVIDWDGTIYEGRWARKYYPWEAHTSEDVKGRVVAGAHVASYNSGSVGVSLMGNFSRIAPPPAMRRALARLLAWEADRHNLPPLTRHTYRNPETGRKRRLYYISGHRDAGFTDCPGGRLYKRLPAIRRDVKAIMGGGKLSSSLTLRSAAGKVPYGESATFTGTLTNGRGAPLGGKTISVYRRDGSGAWYRANPAVSGADGSFSLSIRPERRLKVIAVYDGASGTWGSQSPARAVAVAHAVTLAPQGRVAGPDGVYHYASLETSATLAGEVRPAHPDKRVRLVISKSFRGGPYAEIARRRVAMDSLGAYSYEFVFPDTTPGTTYKVVARMVKDSQHALGKSAPVFLVID